MFCGGGGFRGHVVLGVQQRAPENLDQPVLWALELKVSLGSLSPKPSTLNLIWGIYCYRVTRGTPMLIYGHIMYGHFSK